VKPQAVCDGRIEDLFGEMRYNIPRIAMFSGVQVRNREKKNF